MLTLSVTGCLHTDTTARAATLSCARQWGEACSSLRPHSADHMVALSGQSWVVPEVRVCVCFHSTLFHSCRARGKPTTGSEASVGCNGAVASPKFVPSDSHSSLQSGSILSTCAWSRAAVSLWAPSFLSEAELRLKRSYNNCVAAKATWTKRWAGTFSWRWMFPCFQRQTSSGFMWIRWATSAGYSYIFLLCLCFSHKMMGAHYMIFFFSRLHEWINSWIMVKQMYYWSLFITAQFIFEKSPVLRLYASHRGWSASKYVSKYLDFLTRFVSCRTELGEEDWILLL